MCNWGEGGRRVRDDGKTFSLTSSDKEQEIAKNGFYKVSHSNWWCLLQKAFNLIFPYTSN